MATSHSSASAITRCQKPSPDPPNRTGILAADAADPGVGSCARSLTDRRICPFACSSPPSARLAPHPNLRRPIGGSGLSAGDGELLDQDGWTAAEPPSKREARIVGKAHHL